MERHNVVVYTTRENHEAVREWLKSSGFPELPITSMKPKAIAYIDDRAIRFTNWDDIRKYFS